MKSSIHLMGVGRRSLRRWASAGTLLAATAAMLTPSLAASAEPARTAAVHTASVVSPTPGATSVLDPQYGLTGDASQDPNDTTAFGQAIQDALAGSVRRANGPTGNPQAVVYVPPGSYRLNGLTLPDNVRLEVDAGAVLEPIAEGPLTSHDPTSMIVMGQNNTTPSPVNMSVVGVNSAANTTLKQRAGTVYSGFSIDEDFTVDLKPGDTGGNNYVGFITLLHVTGFLIQNLYVIQDDTIPYCTKVDPSCPTGGGPYPMPTTGRAAIVFRPSNLSGTEPGPYYDPTDGSVINMYTIHAPYGFGPVQVANGHNLTFQDMYSSGGTTLRMETDATRGNKPFDGELNGVDADHIVGQNCNRAVSMASHQQHNLDVHVTNVTAISCNDGLVMESDNARGSGYFHDSTVDTFDVTAGTTAQIPTGNSNGGWMVGQSVQPVNVHPDHLDWSANVTNFSCTGPFQQASSPFELNGTTQVPNCP